MRVSSCPQARIPEAFALVSLMALYLLSTSGSRVVERGTTSVGTVARIFEEEKRRRTEGSAGFRVQAWDHRRVQRMLVLGGDHSPLPLIRR